MYISIYVHLCRRPLELDAWMLCRLDTWTWLLEASGCGWSGSWQAAAGCNGPGHPKDQIPKAWNQSSPIGIPLKGQ